jgi:D-alanine-D-alanine ligase
MKKVLILFGGNSTEHYISCKSAKSIIENIDTRLFSYEVAGISFDSSWYKFNDDLSFLESGNWLKGKVFKIDNIINYLKSFDIVFPITHGNNGEDGKLQGLLDLFNIRYVGSGTTSSVVGFDKSLSKLIFNFLNIPQVPYVVISKNFCMDDILSKLDFPLIVKPCCGGSSIGIKKVNNKKELFKAIKNSFKYDTRVIIEEFINCRELECAILGNKDYIISSPGEIKSCNDFYDYDAKYVQKSTTIIPNDLPDDIIDLIKYYSCRVFKYMNIKDYSRIDFFYDEYHSKIYINEINTIPGFTTISMFPKLMENENICYKDLISILINNS